MLTVLVVVWVISHSTQIHEFRHEFRAEFCHQFQLIDHFVFDLLKLGNGCMLIVELHAHVMLLEGLCEERECWKIGNRVLN